MSLLKEFRAFALKGNVIDLAVAVVIGNAFGAIVSALVSDLIMPLVDLALPGGDWRSARYTPLQLPLGHLLGAVVDFVLIAAVLFVVVVKMGGYLLRRDAAAAPAPPPGRTCPECLEPVPRAARRCRACTSPLPAA